MIQTKSHDSKFGDTVDVRVGDRFGNSNFVSRSTKPGVPGATVQKLRVISLSNRPNGPTKIVERSSKVVP